MSKEVLVRVEQLYRYYSQTCAVDNVSFDLAKGEVLGFLGPNGAGKTSTMQMITGNLAPSAGRISIQGIDLLDRPKPAKREIGYLPEQPPVYRELTVDEYLLYCAKLNRIARSAVAGAVATAKERCGLGEVGARLIGNLSKGYQQRVGIAQAIIHTPAVVVLDEPTVGLDPIQIREIRALIRELGEEHGIILSTHILPEVQATCDRIIIISDGRLVADDTPDSLTERESGGVVRVVVKGQNGASVDAGQVQSLLSAVPGVRAVAAGDGEGNGTLGFLLRTQGSEDPREGLFRAAVENNLVLLDLHREHVSLEDTFRRLTRGDGGADA